MGYFTHFSLISKYLVYFESLTLYLYVTSKIQFLLLRMHLQQMELNFSDGYIQKKGLMSQNALFINLNI